MFNPFKSESNKATNDTGFVMTDDIRIAIDEAGLTDDPAVRTMIENGFVSPSGEQKDPFKFIADRKALVDSGEYGAEAPKIRTDQLVTPSAGEGSERKLSDIDA